MKLKFLTIILALFTLTSCSQGISAERFFAMEFYEKEVIPSTVYLERGETAAVEFYAAAEFSGIEVLAAKVSADDTLTVTLYKFNADYKTTIKDGKVIEKATFRNYESRDTLLLSFKTAPEGKYLLTFSTKNNAGICLATYPSEQAKGNVNFYLNDAAYSDGAFYASVIFNGDRLIMDYFKSTSSPITPAPENPEENLQEEEPSEENGENESGNED